MKAFPTQQEDFLEFLFSLRRTEMSYYLLHGTDKMIAVAIEGIVAHGQGGNQGKYLVL